jgi:sterol desaturase/sphingolipid hydroxylase (fatty acid hydroxylase superfamily)
MDAITSRIVEMLGASVATYGFAFAFITALELILPRERQSLRGRVMGASFWAVWVIVNAIVTTGYHAIWAGIGVQPLVTLPLRFEWAGVAAIVLAPLAGAVVYDFFFYWFHRAQHRWLWRFHAVHHSVRELNGVNTYHHLTEPLFQTLFLLIPVSLILSDTGQAAAVATVILYLHSLMIHSSTRLHLGPLRAVLVDNRFHRIHHSLEERHFDRNFGAFTTVWDRVFGTAHFPAPCEWPATGLCDVDQPRNLREWIDLPWRLKEPDPQVVNALTADAI